MYNYEKEIKADIISYLQDHDIELNESNVDELYDVMLYEDCITGNGSGSYTFNFAKAREYVTTNVLELVEACNELGIDNDELGRRFLNEDWEWMDVTIRVHLLSSVLYSMI